MSLSVDTIKDCLTALGFRPQSGESGIYSKSYAKHDGYAIFADIGQGKIEYDRFPTGDCVKVSERTTSNFAQTENLVVLECVDRLLEMGYPPSSIELEKSYPSGRGSIRLDILIRRPDGTPFLMMECKTWGAEYEKERNKMLRNKGQLFTYYSCDRATEYLCLYTSRIANGKTETQYAVVDVDSEWRNLSGVKEIYEHWNKTFRDNGIFERYAAPYNVRHQALTYRDLQSLGEEDSGKIYNQIMEILRHNAISDKPNAFNKLLNLFVCKIIDEDRNPDEELWFQWRGEDDSDEALQLRLNDLYMDGMFRFLEIEVTDHKQEEVLSNLKTLNQLGADKKMRDWIWKLYTDSRLKKSPNFAFVEVQDERTFQLNAKVVREMVILLQGYKFRYEQKHEFLGSFFELLLNTSMKQEAGQYFTPVPVTRFMISALPLREMVQKRLDSRAGDPLPAVIDYACGSGHFLTEYMSQMQALIDSGTIDLSKASPRVRSQFQSWQGFTKFLWAKERVYGIDLDNRLVKTTKVSAFFNGDGEASVIWANGLDHFTRSDSYRGLLAHSQEDSPRDNGRFDILISNPPYSVEAFRNTLRFGEEAFELFPFLTENSSEIECLFVERMKQLLRVGGWAAVILPSSILTNGGIHARAREILFRHFRVKSIVELGSNTFMETNTNTVVLFLERRSDNDHRAAQMEADRFLATKLDVAASGLEHAFSAFAAQAYDRITFADYVSLFGPAPTEAMKKHELYRDYARDFGEAYREKAAALEREKIICFLLTWNQEIVLVKTGKKQEEKQFLGYEFSKRRGHEGLHPLPGGTKLYDEAHPLNPKKAAGYIYRAFLGERTQVDESLRENIFYGPMSGFLEYGTSRFDRVVQLGKKISVRTSHPMESVENLARLVTGVTYGRDDQVYEETDNRILTADNITEEGEFQIVKTIYLRPDLSLDHRKKLRKDDILICLSSGSREHVGKCAMIDRNLPYYAGGFMGILRRTREEILPKYLWAVLSSPDYRAILGQDSTGKNINNLGSRLGGVKIPVPPVEIQRKIVEEYETIERNQAQIKAFIRERRADLEQIFTHSGSLNTAPLGQCVQCNPSKSMIAGIPDGTVVSFVEMSSVSNEGRIICTENRLLGDVRRGSYTYFQDDDILIAKITPCMENGKCALAVHLSNGIGFGSSEFHVFRCGVRILPAYLFGYLNRSSIRLEAEKVMTGKSGHRRVPVQFYQNLQIPLPPMEEQRRIAAEIQQREAEIDRLNAQREALKREQDSILKKYL